MAPALLRGKNGDESYCYIGFLERRERFSLEFFFLFSLFATELNDFGDIKGLSI